MTDRELLELAAKAAGSEVKATIVLADGTLKGIDVSDGENITHYWHPLADDGDALRLAVALSLRVLTPDPDDEMCTVSGDTMTAAVDEPNCGDPCAATRRAIVRAAAEIGRTM